MRLLFFFFFLLIVASFTSAYIIDKKLDAATDDEHSRLVKDTTMEERAPKQEFSEDLDEFRNESFMSLLDDVASISNLGIDVSFLKDVRDQVLVPPIQQDPENTVPEYMMEMRHMNTQQQLNHIGQELKDLAHLQETRLCQPPPTMLMTQAPEPGPVEHKLAVNIQHQLAHQMATHTAPGAFVNDSVIHDAIGVDMDDGDLFSEFFVTQFFAEFYAKIRNFWMLSLT
uniref:Secreted protein n=1 Tax=Caenorhabditis tropicalis TaxID=1561998 RepID=A0A1I7UJJ2_9PELO